MTDAGARATFHDRAVSDVAVELRSNSTQGLTAADAAARLSEHGPNALAGARGRSLLTILLLQFRSLIVLLLAVASAIAFVMGDAIEGTAILVVIVLNALIGFATEWKAAQALDSLRDQAVPMARVRRDGVEAALPARDLVPGDLILLAAGDRVPADARVLESVELQVDESSLTGESLAVLKATDAVDASAALGDRPSVVHMGTTVMAGRGAALVTTTGAATELGQIDSMIADVGDRTTPLESKLEQLNRSILVLVLVLCAVIVLAGWLRGNAILRMLEVGVSLAIAAVPEGLLAVTTMTLAVGMQRMARMRALVRRLPAVEALGSTTVICTDKTGTLTRNEMTARVLLASDQRVEISGSGYSSDGELRSGDHALKVESPGDADDAVAIALRIGALCNDATVTRNGGDVKVLGDPTEVALLVLAEKAGMSADALAGAFTRVGEQPFDSVTKRMLTVHRKADGARVVFAKGAPSAMLDASAWLLDKNGRSAMTEAAKTEWREKNDALAGGALRVLGLAFRPLVDGDGDNVGDFARDMTFVGLVGMMDPLSDGVKETIETCRRAGIRVVMITGDQLATATEIARQLALDVGLGGVAMRVVHARELDGLDDAAWQKVVSEASVFARVTPEHKLQIVRALQQHGDIVAMTGDGVNDAPALKASDIGIAMGIRGTDVAKDAADIVITDDNFSTIVGAVEQGRVIVSNILRFIHYLFACNFAEILTVFTAIMLGWPLPIAVLQILWLNMVTDLFPALALAMEPAADDVMQQPPRDPEAPLMTRSFGWLIGWQGVLLAAATLVPFRVGMRWYGADGTGLEHAVTIAFMTLAMVQIAHALNVRSRTDSLFSRSLFRNAWLLAAIALSVLVQLSSVYVPFLRRVLHTVPLAWQDWSLILACTLLVLAVVEVVKWIGRERAAKR
ncbi:MAG: HAD-IC family P-type ATPase [Gemmatimonadaceae bacterium]|nr:HAD-IC family P-type ATPase [Gemmatimonadaceae bacterium]